MDDGYAVPYQCHWLRKRRPLILEMENAKVLQFRGHLKLSEPYMDFREFIVKHAKEHSGGDHGLYYYD